MWLIGEPVRSYLEVGCQIILQIASPWTIVGNVFGCVMLPSGNA